MALLKTAKAQLIRIVAENPFNIPARVFEVINGAVPGPLRPFCEPYEGPRPFPLPQIDAVKFAHDTRERPAAQEQPNGRLTQAEVLRLLGWRREDYEIATGYGFPKPRWTAATSVGRNQVALFSERDVRQWIEGLQALVTRTRFSEK